MAFDIDAAIPLAAGQIPQNFQQGFMAPADQQNAMLQMQLRMQQLRQVQQSENALRQLYSNPANLDETGRPTANAMGQLMQADPRTGLGLQNQYAQIDERTFRAGVEKSAVSEAHKKTAHEIGVGALNVYEETMRATNDPKLARQRMEETRAQMLADAVADNSLPKDIAQRFPPADPVKYRALASAYDAARTKPLTAEQQFKMQNPKPEVRKDYRPDGQEIDYQYFPPTPANPQGRTTDLQGNPYIPSGAGKGEAPHVTKDEMGRPITVNPRTGESKLVSPQGGEGTPSPAAASDLHGEEYLKTLDKGQQDQVKALADGRMAFPSGFALRSPYWQRMLTQVSQYDPSFDAVNFNSRSKTRADFTSGQSARNITAINTTIGHMGSTLEAGDKLNNFRESVLPGITTLNRIKNWYQSSRGDPRVVEFEESKNAVTREMTRVFRGTGGNVADIKDWEKGLNDAMTPEQLHGSIEKGVDLLRSRIDSLGDQYNRGMGRSSDPLQLLAPKARETLAKLPGGADAKDEPANFDMSAPTKKGDAPPVSAFGPGVKRLTNEHGETYELRDGKPVKVN